MRLPAQLLRRKSKAHKGNFGHVFILAGSSGLSGAAVLSCHAALRSGAGLITLGVPKGINNTIIKIKPPEVMTKPLPQTSKGTIAANAFLGIKSFLKDKDILVVGPGLSQNKSTQSLIRRLISSVDKPMVIDADGLNALAGHLDILCKIKATVVFTPHPGEMARLIRKSVSFVQKNRKKVAKDFARKYNSIIILKGHKTIVANKDGKIYINKTGNPGMATAGSGDVLTGIVASFLAQGLNAFKAAKFAVYMHGLAGDLAAGEKTQLSLVASDIIDCIPKAIKRLSN